MPSDPKTSRAFLKSLADMQQAMLALGLQPMRAILLKNDVEVSRFADAMADCLNVPRKGGGIVQIMGVNVRSADIDQAAEVKRLMAWLRVIKTCRDPDPTEYRILALQALTGEIVSDAE